MLEHSLQYCYNFLFHYIFTLKVNLFFHDYDNPKNAEIEIMVAETKYQRKGFAKEALKLMMDYGVKNLGVERYFAKIHKINEISINLFKRYT